MGKRAVSIFKRWLHGEDYAQIARDLGLLSGRVKQQARLGARETNYMGLLIKYMALVGEAEGIDFLDSAVPDEEGKSPPIRLSEPEIEELRAISKKARWYLL